MVALVGRLWGRRRKVARRVWASNDTGGRRGAGAITVAPAVDMSLVWGAEAWGLLTVRGAMVVGIVR